MAFTVTATPSGASFHRGVDLKVFVLTNATAAGGASNGGRGTASPTTPSGSLTPNFSSSFVAFSVSADGITSMAAAATNNTYDNSPGGHTDTWVSRQGHYTGTVTASTPLTYGASSGTGDDHANWCAYEIPASGGTITVDGSSPAGVTTDTGTSIATGSFTPPVGAVLVACVCAGGNGTGGGVTVTMSDTAGLGIIWTQQVTSLASDNFQPTYVFTAAVPPSTAPFTRSAQAQTSRTWQRKWNHFTRPAIPAQVQQVSVRAGVAAVSAQAPQPPPVITGLAGGTAGHFINNFGGIEFFYNQVVFGLPANAGRWNGLSDPANWQQDFDQYFAQIAAYGYTVAEVHPWGHTHTGCNNDLGNTWDSVSPWTTLPTLNNTFWQRIDYMLNSALHNGITVLMCLTMQCDMGIDAFAGTGVFNGTSAANIQTACQNIAARYAGQSNVIFFSGDDYNENDDTRMSASTTGLAAGGYAGPMAVENYSSGTTSRRDLSGSPTGTQFTFGGAVATFNWVYYYWVTGWGVEQAYKENSQIPVVWGDGFFPGGGGGEPSDTHILRNMTWWALSSGARGASAGSETVLRWPSAAMADLTTNQLWFSTTALNVYNAFTALTGWQNLLPDNSSTLVTAGRGTRPAYNSAQFQASDLGTINYVTAAVTPDKSLAVIYCAVAMSITIDQSQIGGGAGTYTATWVDPASGATQSATPGSTYSSSGLGNNSAGNADWVLVLQGPPSTLAPAGAASVTVAAPAPQASVKVTAGVAAVTAAAPAPSAAETVTAAVAGVSAVAPAPVAAETVTAGVALTGVVAPQASVTTSAGTSAPAGVAAVSVAAPAASIAETVTAAVAPALAAAPAPGIAVTVTAGAATVAAAAPAPQAAVSVTAAVSVVLTAAPAATAAETVSSGVSIVGAVAKQPVVNTSGSTSAPAAVAPAAALAMGPSPAVTVTAGVAAVAAVGLAASASSGAGGAPPAAPVSAAARAPSLAITVTAGVAAVAVLGLDVPPKFTVGTLTARDAPGGTLTARDAPGGSAGGTLTASDIRTGGPS